jgi:hypothetical protein
MTEAQLIAALEDGSLPPAAFRQRDHVRVAWHLLRELPLLAAMTRFITALQSYSAAIGKPDRYHATITWAYLHAIHERLERGDRALPWADFEAANPELFARDFLASRYRGDTLASPLARRVFVLPDLR